MKHSISKSWAKIYSSPDKTIVYPYMTCSIKKLSNSMPAIITNRPVSQHYSHWIDIIS